MALWGATNLYSETLRPQVHYSGNEVSSMT